MGKSRGRGRGRGGRGRGRAEEGDDELDYKPERAGGGCSLLRVGGNGGHAS